MAAFYPDFESAIDQAFEHMRTRSKTIHTGSWQGIDISKRPEAKMHELTRWSFRVPFPGEDLDNYRKAIQPNLPWADNHFLERVCGYPMNPGTEWKNWPWARSASGFVDERGRFEINYMERYWAAGEFEDTPEKGVTTKRLTGIRGRPYGDLGKLLDLLTNEPDTRQAWLPVFFPEDTGAGGRVPCSLGYHWLMRDNRLDCYYPIRSCDMYRHFRDDIYLTCRLTLWLLDQLRERNQFWETIRPGYFEIWIGSLHIFVNDYVTLFKLGRKNGTQSDKPR